MMRPDRLTLLGSALPLALFAAVALWLPDSSQQAIEHGFRRVGDSFGAFWQWFAVINLGVAAGLCLSPWGSARLGGIERPQMDGFRWVSILLCTLLAGGGVFWSAAEPIYHFTSPPPLFGEVVDGTRRAAGVALAQSHLHWGFLAWTLVGCLAAVALSAARTLDGVAYRPRSLLHPLLGARVDGPFGSIVDAVSIIAVVAGTVGPIGFLALQLSAAAESGLGIPDSYVTQLALLGALVALYTVSAASGLQRGIQLLSRMNVMLAIFLGGVLLVLGPTASVVGTAVDSFALYLREAPAMALYRGDKDWLGYWTVFYWAWFIGYAPIMAIFIARVSAGRTVRELVIAVSLIAPLVTNLWFAMLGGTGLGLELADPGVVSAPLEETGLAAALLAIVGELPGAVLLVPAFVILVFCFLATTGDSIAYAISVVISRRDDPPVLMRVLWACAMGVLAAVLLRLGAGGINALQQFIVITAAPVSLLVLPTLITGPMAARRLHLARHAELASSAPGDAVDQPAG